MVMWATPEWEGDWSGDSAEVLDACEAVEHVLREVGRVLDYTRIRLDWEGGSREESSIEDARNALRFAEPPQTFHVRVAFGSGEMVTVRSRRSEVPGHRVRVSIDVREDFDLAQRLVDAARHAVEGAPEPEAPEAPEIESPTEVAQAPPQPVTRLSEGSRGWVTRHRDMLAAIGVLFAVVAAIAAVIALFL